MHSKPTELIVCRNQEHAKRLRGKLQDHPNIRVASCTTPSEFRGFAPARITVCEGVDLFMIHDGSRLADILRHRQKTWGDAAVFIDLSN